MSALWLALLSQPAPLATAPFVVPEEQLQLLNHWYAQVGVRRNQENFGDLVVRAAAVQLGKPYYDAPQSAGPETLRVELRSFQCVSLVEDSLAVARCVWRDAPTTACFLEEVERSRYRDGRLVDYGARLHYFTEWLEDNARRGRMRLITDTLGGEPTPQTFSYMTEHVSAYPALQDPATRTKIASVETQLSAEPHVVLNRGDIKAALTKLQSGDIIGLVSDKHPGMGIIHTGFVYVGKNGKRLLLHAGQYHKKVLITGTDLADYVMRRPERLGLMVARPTPP